MEELIEKFKEIMLLALNTEDESEKDNNNLNQICQDIEIDYMKQHIASPDLFRTRYRRL